jgi:quinone-modifying oxidoreductase subunit QmoC
MQYANLFPHWLLIGFFTFFLTLAVLLAGIGALRFWNAMKEADAGTGEHPPVNSLVGSIVAVVKDIFTHQRFGKCKTLLGRRQAHLTAFYGFWILFLVSGWAVIILYIINPLVEEQWIYPFNFLNPAKLLANIGAIALVVGCAIAIRDRLKNESEAGKSTDFDWMFLWILFLVGITGIFTEALRYAQAETVGYIVYFVHLILAFMLLIYLPYSKFAHLVYRTVALVYAEYSGRTPASISQKAA